MQHDPFDFDRPCDPPLELVPVTPHGDHQLPRDYRKRVAIYTVHDGGAIPDRFRLKKDGSPLIDPAALHRHFVEMRDWGANVVAENLAAALGLHDYARCRVARVLLDFNRFPGSTRPNNDEPLDALAIGRLYSGALDHHEKTHLLEAYYDRISAAMEKVIEDKLIGISIHTYDETHASQNKRADLSLISLPLSYQRESQLTYGVFDPMYPDHLAESTCSRILRDRVSLNLERSGFRVIHNHPYPLPDGSIEMRAQVWHFFRYLRLRFEAEHPDLADDPAYKRVWTMLQDTNLRLAEAEALRSFLHRFRRVHEEKRKNLIAALDAYRHVRRFLFEGTVITDYRRSGDRPSSLGIEVRKDLVCTFDPDTGRPQRPTPPQEQTAKYIAGAIAGAIATYIDTDREVYEHVSREMPLPPVEEEIDEL